MASKDNKYDRLDAPPAPLFTNKPERDLVKQINDELIERVIGQKIAYYAIDVESTNFHPLYGEAIEKTFFPPIHVMALINYEERDVTTTNKGTERESAITIHFHKRRLTQDQNVLVREGDFVCYGDTFYEIVAVKEPQEIWGQTENKMEVSAECVETRQGIFDSK